MNRPIYESEEDLRVERDVAKHIESLWGCDLEKMHMKYIIDFMAFREGKAVAVVEVRRRFNPSNKYTTFYASLAKWNRGREYCKANNLAFCFVVRWDDGMFIYKFQDGDEDFKITMGGSQPKHQSWRGDPQDYEPVIHIPVSRFKKI